MEDKHIILDDIIPSGAWKPVHASKGKRLVHYIIDYIITSTATSFISLVFFSESSPAMIYLLIGVIIHFVYYVPTEYLMSGKTIGKLITQTRVVTHEGYHPELSVILLRTLCRLVPFDPLSFLFSEPGGWHDMWSKTWVVEDHCLSSVPDNVVPNNVISTSSPSSNAWKSVHASKGKRLVHYIIDYIITFIATSFISLVFFSESSSTMSYLLIFVIIHFVYYVPTEYLMSGKTIGKLITPTRVVTHEGYHPELSVILLRTLCRLVPFDPLSFLFSEPGGWHDMWSKTWVVEDHCLSSAYHINKYV